MLFHSTGGCPASRDLKDRCENAPHPIRTMGLWNQRKEVLAGGIRHCVLRADSGTQCEAQAVSLFNNALPRRTTEDF